MSRTLTYATVCSGVECCSAAAFGLPLRPVFFSEIEPFPCAVLKARHPRVPNLGDMRNIKVSADGKEISNGTTGLLLDARLDILAGGTPCQDVSAAGKRAGMAEGSGTRSSLAFEFVRLARELGPRWVLWENVAGCLDSRSAADFLRFAAALGDCGYSVAWRVLDAQHVRVDGVERAVPQRRRRVWLVGRLGDDGRAPAEVLFEPDGLAGDRPPRRETGAGFARPAGGGRRVAPGAGGRAAFGWDGYNQRATGDVTKTLGAGMEHGSPDGIPVVALEGNGARPSHHGGGASVEGASFTLNAVERHAVAYGMDWYEAGGLKTVRRETATTLAATGGGTGFNNCTVECFENHAQDSRVRPAEVSDTRSRKDGTGGNNLPLVLHTNSNGGEVMPTLTPVDLVKRMTGEADKAGAYVLSRAVADENPRFTVRRLTPTECERLMALPDGHTIPDGLEVTDALVEEFTRIHDAWGAAMAEYSGKRPPKPKTARWVRAWLARITDPATCPDAPRYKAVGNGWAVNCARWVLLRIRWKEGVEW